MFYIEPCAMKCPNGSIQYYADEYSFNSVPTLPSMPAVLIQNLNLTFDIPSRSANDIWGYHNYTQWKKAELKSPASVDGRLILTSEIEYDGIYSIERADEWETHYDPQTGWVCIGGLETQSYDAFTDKFNGCVEFYPNVIAAIKSGECNAVWMRPTMVK